MYKDSSHVFFMTTCTSFFLPNTPLIAIPLATLKCHPYPNSCTGAKVADSFLNMLPCSLMVSDTLPFMMYHFLV